MLGPQTQASPFAGRPDILVGTGLDGRAHWLAPAGRAVLLPRLLTDGVLVDLEAARSSTEPRFDESTAQVWLAGDAPPSVEQALLDTGLRILDRDTVSGTRQTLLNEPSTRGAAVSLTIGELAFALALLTLLAARVAEASARRRDWSALAEGGLRAGSLWRLAAAEIGLPALIGVVVGGGSGLLAAQLAAPRLPLVDPALPGPPLDLHVAWVPAGSTLVVAAVVIVVVSVVAGWLETRSVGGR